MGFCTLACGPYFDPAGMITSLVLFLAIKPLAYFAFIQAFRYRVSRPIPMRTSQAIALTGARAGLGIVIVGFGALIIRTFSDQNVPEVLLTSWTWLYAERLFSWWIVGWRGAGLRGRRLIGWIISGTLINAAFDAAMVWGLFEGIVPQIGIVAGVAVFIGLLHATGQRESLKARFSDKPLCAMCGYDLTGNLSGTCPECGKGIGAQAVPA